MNVVGAAGSPVAAEPSLAEFLRDPLVTVACVLLIVVSVGWIVITRMIVRRIKRLARRRAGEPAVDLIKPPRDIWSIPP